MYISLDWTTELVNLYNFEFEEVVEKLTLGGFEVEEVIEIEVNRKKKII